MVAVNGTSGNTIWSTRRPRQRSSTTSTNTPKTRTPGSPSQPDDQPEEFPQSGGQRTLTNTTARIYFLSRADDMIANANAKNIFGHTNYDYLDATKRRSRRTRCL